MDRSLLDEAFTTKNLTNAFDRIASNRGSRSIGVDGKTVTEVSAKLQEWIKSLRKNLRSGRFQASGIRTVDVPKFDKPGQTRRLGILTVRDRVVHAALKQALQRRLEPKFSDRSFGFRPQRSVAGALAAVIQELDKAAANSKRKQLRFGCDLDVANCFPSIDHQVLAKILAENEIDDKSVDFIMQLYQPGKSIVHWPHRWVRIHSRDIGIVQGSSLSPLLCNLYLHPLDQLIAKRYTRGDVQYFRYADDMVLFASSRSKLVTARNTIAEHLRKQYLRLRDANASVGSVQKSVVWLGAEIYRRSDSANSSACHGYRIREHKIKKMFSCVDQMTELPDHRLDRHVINIAYVVRSLNRKLLEWHHYYANADNAQVVFYNLDRVTRERVGRLLGYCTGHRGRALNKRFRVWLPGGGDWTWQIDGVRLRTMFKTIGRRCVARRTRRFRSRQRTEV